MVIRLMISRFARQHIISKFLIGLAFVLFIATFTYWTKTDFRLNGRKCFMKNDLVWDVELLEDIMTSEKKPQPGKSVFFHETSCSNGIVKLNAR